MEETKRRSVWDVMQEQYDIYQTGNNTYDMFKPGDTVRIITPAQDHNFFDMDNSYGRVISNSGRYLGLKIFVYNIIKSTVSAWGFEAKDVIHSEETHNKKLETAIQKYVQEKEFEMTGGRVAKFNSALLGNQKILYLETDDKMGMMDMEHISNIFIKYFPIDSILMSADNHKAIYNKKD
jgi:hypothetical protein